MPASRFAVPAIAVLALAVALSGCGRRGPLEPPGTVEAPAATPTVFGTSPAPEPAKQAPPPKDEPFVLDAII